jgi:hypothetical protein
MIWDYYLILNVGDNAGINYEVGLSVSLNKATVTKEGPPTLLSSNFWDSDSSLILVISEKRDF